MRRIGHWTPRYVVDRVRWGLYQRRNPELPWLTPQANSMLSTLLRPSDRGFEWGCGRSTLWLAQQVSHLRSIEDDPQWHARISGRLREKGQLNVDLQLLPRPEAGRELDSAYARACLDEPDGSLDFALVDGSARDACCHYVMPKIAPGGILILDNAERFLDFPTRSPDRAKYRSSAVSVTWDAIRGALANWRLVWTSSGVTDTAVFIKPFALANDA